MENGFEIKGEPKWVLNCTGREGGLLPPQKLFPVQKNNRRSYFNNFVVPNILEDTEQQNQRNGFSPAHLSNRKPDGEGGRLSLCIAIPSPFELFLYEKKKPFPAGPVWLWGTHVFKACNI